MSSLLPPLHLLLMMFAGWVNRHRLNVIEYLQEENRVLKERLGERRIRFTDAERRRLARKAYALGRRVLNELDTLVIPDTLLRWHRELVASKWDYSRRRGPGRPRIMNTIVDLILRMALENRSWGYRASAARSPIWGMRWDAAPSPTSSMNTASSPPLSVTGIPDGRRFSKPTGNA
jgi:putative transposase